MKYLILIFIFFSFHTLADDEVKMIDFNEIKDVLKEDGLLKEVIKKRKRKAKVKKIKKKLTKKLYDYPSEDDFWPFISELWLIKNAAQLKWDSDFPEYGLDNSLNKLFSSLGYYGKKYQILLIDNPSIPHFALPTNKNEGIFLISVPFARTLDLSKLEICLLILEDFLRLETQFFKDKITPKDFKKWAGSNFEEKKVNLSVVEESLKNYQEFIFEKGFSFKNQFEVTKIDRLIKSNNLFKRYSQLYPSPEMQIKWLSPKKKVL